MATHHCSCLQNIQLIVFAVRLVLSFELLWRQLKFDSDFKTLRLDSCIPLALIFPVNFNAQCFNTYYWVYLWCNSFCMITHCNEKSIFNFDFVRFTSLSKNSQTHTRASWKPVFVWPWFFLYILIFNPVTHIIEYIYDVTRSVWSRTATKSEYLISILQWLFHFRFAWTFDMCASKSWFRLAVNFWW